MQAHTENIGALPRDRSNDSFGEQDEAHHDLEFSTAVPHAPVSRAEIRAKIGVLCVLLVAAAAVLAVVIWRFRAATALPKLHLIQQAPPKEAPGFPVHWLPATPVQNLQLKQVPANIVIMAQVGNPAIWPEMRVCISNVVAATRLAPNKTITVRLHLAMTQRSEVVEADAKNIMSGLHEATIVMVQNRGMDIGQFMQQLQLMRNKSADVDIILKIHSKTQSDWRRQMICNLCGNPQQVLTIINMFDAYSNLGIVGPPGLIFGYYARGRETWGGFAGCAFIGDQEEDMRRTWDLIFPNKSVSFPTRDRYLIAAGSFFWARPAPLLSDEFQTSIPVFLDILPDVYQRNVPTAQNKYLYALERVIPTMMHGHFMLDYATAPPVGLWPAVDNPSATISDRPCQ